MTTGDSVESSTKPLNNTVKTGSFATFFAGE